MSAPTEKPSDPTPDPWEPMPGEKSEWTEFPELHETSEFSPLEGEE